MQQLTAPSRRGFFLDMSSRCGMLLRGFPEEDALRLYPTGPPHFGSVFFGHFDDRSRESTLPRALLLRRANGAP
jgi:hypothetical protein